MASRFRIGTALLGAAAALTFSALPAHAEVKITPDRGGQEQGHDVHLKSSDPEPKFKKETTWVIKLRIEDDKDRSNVLAYCVELPTPLKDGDVLKEVPWKDHPGSGTKFKENAGKILWILNRSYPNKPVKEVRDAFKVKDLDKQDVIAATQAALWHFSDNFGLDVDNKQNDPQVVELYKKFVAEATSEEEVKPTLSIDPTSLDGKPGQKLGPFTVKTTATEVKLTGNLPAGVTIVDKNGTPLEVKQKADGLSIKGLENVTEFYVNVPEGTADGEASFKLSAQADIAVGRLFVASNGDNTKSAQSLVVAQPQKAKVEKEAKASWKAGVVPTTTTTTTTATTTTTTPETTTPATSTTPANPAPGGGEDDLASTGASILWPLLGGLVLVGAGVGALFVVRRKKAGL
ncbi:thioester domain-containing protein [Lentzea sp. NBRC 102530]|uniref:thioester domain-containing protein n=1 Tax=Lentzea sp. NBRC 102530 TaxID=3032201 RepID=UPI0024A34F5C|nr:thioester domain-containing protein [Lentzea sp. NBRC 102530]GLY48007.1 TQXA domain-containing protein [Lentzea sp. NBRC 102530]